jgi:hypothetical protein
LEPDTRSKIRLEAAFRLEQVLIHYHGELSLKHIDLLKRALRLLRNPPLKKPRGMKG